MAAWTVFRLMKAHSLAVIAGRLTAAVRVPAHCAPFCNAKHGRNAPARAACPGPGSRIPLSLHPGYRLHRIAIVIASDRRKRGDPATPTHIETRARSRTL